MLVAVEVIVGMLTMFSIVVAKVIHSVNAEIAETGAYGLSIRFSIIYSCAVIHAASANISRSFALLEREVAMDISVLVDAMTVPLVDK